ncbi:glycoside hydrolase family protein [Shewanella xiamenensis]|uniref:glycoside hydrolase family protein n=1 Tax=Shewanella xiamenensis TaxID=332186 RepID=UPI0021C0C9A6|nr:glycoside hydrolase family protein [Shewanella xiamenensis]MCT8876638.1 glycoside hydrolase family protein [Shewanella xiamenensis]
MDLKQKIKVNEGTIEYQKYLGTYKDGLFQKYKCSQGVWTIGYGHAIKASENFDFGITEEQADAMLLEDIKVAQSYARQVHVDSHDEVNDVLTEMIFQLGYSGTKKFKKMIQALKEGSYTEAANQMKDSRWYNQTPNRVGTHIQVLKSIK